MTLTNFIECAELSNDPSFIPKALRLTRSIKTSTTDITRQKLDESSIPDSLLKFAPNDDELKIMLADNLAHLAWVSLTKEDLEDIKRMNKNLLTNGYVSENYLTEVINKILFKVCDEDRINQKLNQIDKVYRKSIILVANHLLSLCSESEPKCITDEKILLPKKKYETLQRTTTKKTNSLKSIKSSTEKVKKTNNENIQPLSLIKNKININDKKCKIPKKLSKVLIKNKKLKVSEEIQKSFLDTKKKGFVCKEVKDRIEDLTQEATKLGLAEIKFPKSIYANERAKLALLERQIKGQIRLKLIERGNTKSEHKIKVQNSSITK